MNKKKREVVVLLQGGLADQIKKVCFGLLLSRKQNRTLILNTSNLTNNHLGERSALKNLMKHSQIVFEDQPISLLETRSGLRGKARILKFGIAFKIASLILDIYFGFLTDLSYFGRPWATKSPRATFFFSKLFGFRKRVYVNGYFPSTKYWHALNDKEKELFRAEDASPIAERNYALIHIRCGDIYTHFKDIGMLHEDYYLKVIQEIQDSYPNMSIFAISDNNFRARNLYPNLNIDYLEKSDIWAADKVFATLSAAPVLAISHSGLSIFAALASNNSESKVFAPRIGDGKLWRPEYDLEIANVWNFIDTKLWYPT